MIDWGDLILVLLYLLTLVGSGAFMAYGLVCLILDAYREFKDGRP